MQLQNPVAVLLAWLTFAAASPIIETREAQLDGALLCPLLGTPLCAPQCRLITGADGQCAPNGSELSEEDSAYVVDASAEKRITVLAHFLILHLAHHVASSLRLPCYYDTEVYNSSRIRKLDRLSRPTLPDLSWILFDFSRCLGKTWHSEDSWWHHEQSGS
ncbi:hypothetical protein AC579_4084 [Pseudocercospora musae]|uniref:Uncharacterized protein n=1 Tax=Pseudocercospora musae TaxID=113226 RepID=A0A139IJG4_9PEZI|nr:hypothetical protein AC579_4084 [Pseudocercospora musae]